MTKESWISGITAFIIAAGGALGVVFVGEANPTGWQVGAAVLLGLVSGAKDVRALMKLPPIVPLLLLGAVLAGAMTFTGCNTTGEKPTPQAVAYFTLADTKAVVSNAEKVYGDLVVAKKVMPAKERAIDAKIVEFHAAYLLAVKAARFNYSVKTPEDVQALAENLITIINLLAKE